MANLGPEDEELGVRVLTRADGGSTRSSMFIDILSLVPNAAKSAVEVGVDGRGRWNISDHELERGAVLAWDVGNEDCAEGDEALCSCGRGGEVLSGRIDVGAPRCFRRLHGCLEEYERE